MPVSALGSAMTRRMRKIVHDLRSPLSSIEGYARILLSGRPGPLTEKQRSYLEGILASVRVLSHLLDGLRLAEELEEGTQAADEPSDLDAAFAALARDLERAFAAKGARIAADGGGLALARGGRIVEAIAAGLLLAALTTSEENAAVRLSARRRAGGGAFEIVLEAPGASGPGLGAGLELVARAAGTLGGAADFAPGRLAVRLPASLLSR